MKHTVLEKSSGKSNDKAERSGGPRSGRPSFVTCLRNDGYEVSLEIGKVYVVIPDRNAAKFGRVRIVDESNEDYLFPIDYFLPVVLSNAARKAASA